MGRFQAAVAFLAWIPAQTIEFEVPSGHSYTQSFVIAEGKISIDMFCRAMGEGGSKGKTRYYAYTRSKSGQQAVILECMIV